MRRKGLSVFPAEVWSFRVLTENLLKHGGFIASSMFTVTEIMSLKD
jgi:hypothetical protein